MESIRQWLIWIGWRRLAIGAVLSPCAVMIVWWMVRMPPPPIESMIPVTPTAAPTDSAAVPGQWSDEVDLTAPSRIAVHVVGAVEAPGVYELSSGARGDDALRAAGGATKDADLRRVNLAAPLHDGEQLIIPRIGERVTVTTNSAATPASGRSSSATSLIDLNRATSDELERLPGVGPSTAKAIIDHRARNGPFGTIDDLLKVRGIGPAKLAEIRPWVRV